MCVIFWDFDGTLVHSDHLWSGSMYEALTTVDPYTTMTFEQVRICNREGFTWQTPDNDYHQLTGDAWWDFMHAHFVRSYTRFGISNEMAHQAANLVHGILKRYDNYHLFPDALDTLRTCKEHGATNVLLSNNYPDLEDVLVHLGLRKHLDGVILSALEGYDKPRKELFDIAKSRYPASRYVMVGDSESADVVGGKRASMCTILVHTSTPSPLADFNLATLSEIPSLLF